MIIILKGADFSQHNIGTVELSPEEVSSETESLLRNYSRTLSYNQQIGVQRFIKGLKFNGIWDYIENLYIPALAGNVNEVFYNVKKSVKDFEASSEYYELHDGGVRSVGYTSSAVATDDANIAKAYVNASRMNVHFMAYIGTISMTDAMVFDYPFCCNSSGVLGGMYYARTIGNNTFTTYEYNSSSVMVQNIQGASEKNLKGFICISSEQDSIKGRINNMIDGNKSYTAVDDVTFTNTPFRIGYNYARKPSIQNGMRIMSTGHSLTTEQMSKYNELCDTLNSIIV